ncbi:hypothetical protein ACVWZV_008502 [Bradyrhizobium sp. GM5.1]
MGMWSKLNARSKALDQFDGFGGSISDRQRQSYGRGQPRRGKSVRCARALLVLFGLAGAIWSIQVLPSFLIGAPVRELAERILAGDRFKKGVLAASAARIESNRNPIARTKQASAEALISLSLAEEARQSEGSAEADRKFVEAAAALRSLLALNATDSFLWMLLYSVEYQRYGFNSSDLSYLVRSYTLGPNEGWIALRRNRLALAVLSLLDETTQHLVTSEFAEMVQSDLIEDAAENLMGVGWPHRDRLIASLAEVSTSSKKDLSGRLLARGVKLVIPNVTFEERPWQQ